MTVHGKYQNERKRCVNRHVSDLDSPGYISPVGRHRAWIRAGWIQARQRDAYIRGLAVRNAGAHRTAIGVHHRPPRVAAWFGHAAGTHEGSGACRRQDREFRRKVVLGVDAHSARRDCVFLRHTLGAWTMETTTREESQCDDELTSAWFVPKPYSLHERIYAEVNTS